MCKRRVDEERADAEEPDEDRSSVPDPLGEQVPGRVEDGGSQYQYKRKESHEIAASLTGRRQYSGDHARPPAKLADVSR